MELWDKEHIRNLKQILDDRKSQEYLREDLSGYFNSKVIDDVKMGIIAYLHIIRYHFLRIKGDFAETGIPVFERVEYEDNTIDKALYNLQNNKELLLELGVNPPDTFSDFIRKHPFDEEKLFKFNNEIERVSLESLYYGVYNEAIMIEEDLQKSEFRLPGSYSFQFDVPKSEDELLTIESLEMRGVNERHPDLD